MNFVKKSSFAIVLLLFFLLYSSTCFAQENVEELYVDILYEDEIVPLTDAWAAIVTTSGVVGVPAGTYVPGASSYYVKLLQATLNELQFSCGTVDGVYGTNTRNGIMEFQRTYGLTVDGVAGYDTWSRASARIRAENKSVPFQK